MIHQVADDIMILWRTGRTIRNNLNGWISGNAPCCAHVGETPDKRRRGAFRLGGDGSIFWHCFNCGFKTAFFPGDALPHKLKQLLKWMGVDDSIIHKLQIDALRIRDLFGADIIRTVHTPVTAVFNETTLPEDAISFAEWAQLLDAGEVDVPQNVVEAIEYIANRGGNLSHYDFYVSNSEEHNLNQRVIIPCYWEDKLIGYTARATDEILVPKYHNKYESNYVFNMNKQLFENQFVIVSEGPFDAMAIDGVAILGNECNSVQADIIDSLGKEVIVVPDADKAGAKLVDAAMHYNWNVSFPVWQETHKDISSAVKEYGKLFVLSAILDGRQTNKFKIEILNRQLK